MLDMAGDPVAVPLRIERIATLGSVPVLNSLVFAVGAGPLLVNGLPEFARKPRWGYQTVFAPHLAALPPLQGADYAPNMEALIRAAPDVVLTMERAGAQRLRRAGIPALYLSWRQPEDAKAAVRLLGELLGRQAAAERYAAAFDATLAAVETALRGVSERPRVLFLNPSRMSTPLLIAEWWIRAAGGDSVTDDGRIVESRGITIEQVLAWDPDILVVASREEAAAVRAEPRFAALRAVRAGRMLVTPCGAHPWGHRTAEQPLTVLWAAQHFHPARFGDVDLVAEMQRFYRDLFGSELTAAQAREILDGGPRGAPGDARLPIEPISHKGEAP
ncbi:MAG: ABC transporter substrate-binding protein [Rhodocyclaceae bacterium]|nr:ABC transporter substrate-binding protein [Rhodocyclaceae bacterium]